MQTPLKDNKFLHLELRERNVAKRDRECNKEQYIEERERYRAIKAIF
jgi:hypothetical protein